MFVEVSSDSASHTMCLTSESVILATTQERSTLSLIYYTLTL